MKFSSAARDRNTFLNKLAPHDDDDDNDDNDYDDGTIVNKKPNETVSECESLKLIFTF